MSSPKPARAAVTKIRSLRSSSMSCVPMKRVVREALLLGISNHPDKPGGTKFFEGPCASMIASVSGGEQIDNCELQIANCKLNRPPVPPICNLPMNNLQFAIESKKGLEREALDPDNNRDRESPRPRIPLSLTIALF